MNITIKEENDFWDNVEKTESCWIWTGYKSVVYNRIKNKKWCYGRFRINGKFYRAHRISYVLAYGEIQGNMFICHKCDNPSCVRPDHLFMGTPKDNFNDMLSKNRQGFVFRKGENLGESHHNSKLKSGEVWLTKKLLFYNVGPMTQIAQMFRTTKHTIFRIKKGHQWTHVDFIPSIFDRKTTGQFIQIKPFPEKTFEEKATKAKLKAEEVILIRNICDNTKLSNGKIAKMFRLKTDVTIWQIRHRKTWQHI